MSARPRTSTPSTDTTSARWGKGKACEPGRGRLFGGAGTRPGNSAWLWGTTRSTSRPAGPNTSPRGRSSRNGATNARSRVPGTPLRVSPDSSATSNRKHSGTPARPSEATIEPGHHTLETRLSDSGHERRRKGTPTSTSASTTVGKRERAEQPPLSDAKGLAGSTWTLLRGLYCTLRLEGFSLPARQGRSATSFTRSCTKRRTVLGVESSPASAAAALSPRLLSPPAVHSSYHATSIKYGQQPFSHLRISSLVANAVNSNSSSAQITCREGTAVPSTLKSSAVLS
mmetsp:Transcript_3484/g.7428  ORF Transcript_3484/g.7428 Transcript_3484/m.7428 type:complete len:285 (-) Transcript_3484:131-985(-)